MLIGPLQTINGFAMGSRIRAANSGDERRDERDDEQGDTSVEGPADDEGVAVQDRSEEP